MQESLGSFKTLEQVYLKSTQNIDIGDRTFEQGEIIACFDKIDISGLTEFKDVVVASGGFDNRGLVYWETTKELRLNFSQGVFSKTQFALLNNSKVINTEEEELLLITQVEKIEVASNGVINTSYIPYDQYFVYLEETGNKIEFFKEGNHFLVSERYKFQNVIVQYRYIYNNGATVARIGQRFLQGFLELEGKTRVKDDTSGLITTGIIRIPKLKLMSGLSIRLGASASPVVGNFAGIGVPVGSRHNSYVAEFDFLNNDIDSDM